MLSTTGTTKWAYQTVAVQPGAYYTADSWAMNAAADTLLLRLSWYATDDGDGAAIESSDSLADLTGAAPGFRLLSTGAVQAPEGAHSARVRLLLQPATGDPTRAFFDDVHFDRVSGPGLSGPLGGPASSQASGGATTVGSTPAGGSAVLGSQSTPVGLVHVTSAPRTVPTTASGDGSSIPWLTLMIAVPALGIGAFAAEETIRARRSRPSEVSPGDSISRAKRH